MKTLALLAVLIFPASGAHAAAARANLDGAHCFPGVFKPALGHDRITFTSLTADVTVKIFTISGGLVATLSKADLTTDQIVWTPVRTEAADPLANGVYTFVISSPGHKPKRGKFVIMK
jgi:hypothetical protein